MTSIVIHEIGGQMPFQARGTFYGCPFYFRSRHDEWSIDVCGPGEDPVMNGNLLHLEGDDDTMGFMSVAEGMMRIGRSFRAFIDKYPGGNLSRGVLPSNVRDARPLIHLSDEDKANGWAQTVKEEFGFSEGIAP